MNQRKDYYSNVISVFENDASARKDNLGLTLTEEYQMQNKMKNSKSTESLTLRKKKQSDTLD
jgi:hypothetical protein